MATKQKTVQLGQKAKDLTSGFTGYVTARIDQLNGNVQYQVQPKVNKDGSYNEPLAFDQHQLMPVVGAALKVTPVPNPAKFKLGARVKSVISDIQGIATERYTYLNGCERYFIRYKDKDGEAAELVLEGVELEQVDCGLSARFAPLATRTTPPGGPVQRIARM